MASDCGFHGRGKARFSPEVGIGIRVNAQQFLLRTEGRKRQKAFLGQHGLWPVEAMVDSVGAAAEIRRQISGGFGLSHR
ncbi:MAG: hypothetical protein WCC64_21780 [Aliidongia sp.]